MCRLSAVEIYDIGEEKAFSAAVREARLDMVLFRS